MAPTTYPSGKMDGCLELDDPPELNSIKLKKKAAISPLLKDMQIKGARYLYLFNQLISHHFQIIYSKLLLIH